MSWRNLYIHKNTAVVSQNSVACSSNLFREKQPHLFGLLCVWAVAIKSFSSKQSIFTCFSYLSDYLQIKHERTHFKPIFLFFTLTRSVCVLTRSVCVLTQSVCVLTQSVCVLTRSVCVLTRSVCVLKRSVCVLKRSVCAFMCYNCAFICYTCALICYSSALICCNSALMRYTCAIIRYTCAFIRNACVFMYNTCERVRNYCAFARCCEKLSLNIGTFSSAYYNGRLKKWLLFIVVINQENRFSSLAFHE